MAAFIQEGPDTALTCGKHWFHTGPVVSSQSCQEQMLGWVIKTSTLTSEKEMED